MRLLRITSLPLQLMFIVSGPCVAMTLNCNGNCVMKYFLDFPKGNVLCEARHTRMLTNFCSESVDHLTVGGGGGGGGGDWQSTVNCWSGADQQSTVNCWSGVDQWSTVNCWSGVDQWINSQQCWSSIRGRSMINSQLLIRGRSTINTVDPPRSTVDSVDCQSGVDQWSTVNCWSGQINNQQSTVDQGQINNKHCWSPPNQQSMILCVGKSL